MKILAVRGKNLASIAEFDVDFRTPPLADAGLFAITGRTGAGKSTLLDAICLAFFARTPRYESAPDKATADDGDHGNAPQHARALLRRGCTTCMAEVEWLATDGNVYVARFELRKARKHFKAGFSLFDADRTRSLASNKTEFDAAVARLLGLDFAQFTRSVLLAQGDFAAFLRAKEGDRATLLERITGSDVYTRLSLGAHERCRDLEKELAQLRRDAEAFPTLAPEVRARLEGEHDATRAELASCRERKAEAREALLLHGQRAALVRDEASAERSLDAAIEANGAAADVAEELAAIDRIEPERAVFAGEAAATQALAVLEAELTAITRGHAEALADERARGVALEAAASRLAGAEAERDAMTAELREAMRVDAELGVAERARGDAEAAATSAEGALRTARRRLGERAPRAKALALAEVEALVVAAQTRAEASEAVLRGVDPARIREGEQRIAAHAPIVAALAVRRQQHLEHARRGSEYRERARTERAAAATARSEGERLAGVSHEVAAALERALIDEREARKVASLGAHRGELREGAPCPLCGSVEHPWAAAVPDPGIEALAARAASLRAEHDELNRGCAQQLVHARTAAKGADEHDARAEAEERDAAACAVAWTSLRADLGDAGPDAPDGDDAGAWLERRAGEVAVERERLEQERRHLDELQAQVARDRRALDAARAERDAVALRVRHDEARAQLAQAEGALRALREARAQLLGGRATSDVERALRGAIDRATRDADGARKAHGETRDRRAQLEGQRDTCTLQYARADVARRGAAEAVTEALARLAIDDARARTLLAHPAHWVTSRRAELGALRRAVDHCRSVLETRRDQRIRHERDHAPKLSRDEAEHAVAALDDRERSLDDARQRLLAELERDESHRARVGELRRLLEERERESAVWRRLDALIGSADGKRFNKFAQGLTLDVLLAHANHHLAELAPRYRLRRAEGQDLGLFVVDRDMGNEPRSIHGLSGGETFLTSLSLALGLATLSARRTRIDSLFIDEGFGALDHASLEAALGMLETLQAKGKQIGVISHVPLVAERIAVQVHVAAQGNGRSTVQVHATGRDARRAHDTG